MWQSYHPPRNKIIEIDHAIAIVGGYKMKRLTKFFREVAREMRKVSWPRRKELTRYTITVLATVIFFSIFFGVLDLGISKLIRLILE